jgi:peptidoglycan/LPS O-acetylase OafA/YrhL
MIKVDARAQGRVVLSGRATAFVNLARALAALYVVLHHVALARDFHGPASIFKHFGHQAVIAFFLLSGFIIHANERHRVLKNPSGYALRRVARIYPCLLVAMIISVAVVGLSDASWQKTSSIAVANLFGLQDTIATTPGTHVPAFLGNLPLWSLSYEIWFYVLYPVFMLGFVSNRFATNLVAGVVCAGSYLLYTILPDHFLAILGYFSIWWVGAMLAEAYGDGFRNPIAAALPLLGLFATCVVASIPVLLHRNASSVYPVLQANHLWTALVFSIALFGPVGRILASASLRVARPASYVASVSYGLYVFHWPLLTQWELSKSSVGLLFAVLILVGLAWVFDKILASALSALLKRRDPKVQAHTFTPA